VYSKFQIRHIAELSSLRVDWPWLDCPRVGLSANCLVTIFWHWQTRFFL